MPKAFGDRESINFKLVNPFNQTALITLGLIPGAQTRWASAISLLALFPGLHAQLLSLAVQKAGEGLDRFIT